MAATVIIRNPEILGGIPCFRGTRVPFQNLLDYLEAGDTLDQFLEQFPTVGYRGAGNGKGLAFDKDWVRNLLDECLPRDLRKHLVGHDCQTVPQAGLAGKTNGELLTLAEKSGWQVLLTVDRGMAYQQNLAGRSISL